MKHKEKIILVKDTPVERNIFGFWEDSIFVPDMQYEISNRKLFTPPNGADPRYQFELWDDEGFIGAYRIKIKVWNDNVKMLLNEEAAR